MTESETFLLDELYESEAAIRSDAHQEDVKRLAAMERETETLQAKIAAKVSRRALAILAWKQSTAYSEDVHAAVGDLSASIAGPEMVDVQVIWPSPSTADGVKVLKAEDAPDEPCPWIVAEPQAPNDVSHYYSPLADEGPNPPTDFPLCTEGVEAADDELFEESVEPLRKVVGSAMDVSDEQLAEARRADERESARQAPAYSNGLDQ